MEQCQAEQASGALSDVDHLLTQYGARLYNFVRTSVRDDDLAASIVQDCFFKAYSSRDKFRADCSVHTWLRSIALNLVRDSQRAQKGKFWRKVGVTAVDVSEIASALPSSASSPEKVLLAREKVQAVSRVIGSLPGKQGTIFRMRFVDGMDLQEIARSTGMPVGTVRSSLYRAIHIVRAHIRTPR